MNRFAIAMSLLISGCSAVQPVQPWEKGILARPEMTFEQDRLDAALVVVIN